MSDASRSFSVAILATSTVDLLGAAVRSELRSRGSVVQVWCGGFNQYRQEICDAESWLYTRRPTVVVLHLEAEDLFSDSLANPFTPRDQHVRRAVESAGELASLVGMIQSRLPDTLIVLHTVYLRPRHSLTGLEHHGDWGIGELATTYNAELSSIARARRNVVVHDTAALASQIGYRDWFDPRLWYLARCRLSQTGTEALAGSLGAMLCGWRGHSRKCLVLDLDNTLWGGLAGEEGIQGIALGPEGIGRAFLDFQIELANLARKGVLLAICSKNDADVALEIIRRHPSMQLREQDFAAVRINWLDKASNLREIGAELNLGEDSLVFVDDHPAERELIRMGAPAVFTPDWPADPADFKGALIDLAIREFPRLHLTAEDQSRSATYGVGRQRREAQTAFTDLEQYLRSLDMRVRTGRASEAKVPRIAQLTQKTNQFNATTRRYTEADVRRMANDARFLVLWLELQDRFGDEGLVGVLIAEVQEAGSWRIDTLLLSCRVIGRSAEAALLSKAGELLAETGARRLSGEYVRTAKNGVAADVYQRLGFTPTATTESGSLWEFDCATTRIQTPGWIAMDHTDGE